MHHEKREILEILAKTPRPLSSAELYEASKLMENRQISYAHCFDLRKSGLIEAVGVNPKQYRITKSGRAAIDDGAIEPAEPAPITLIPRGEKKDLGAFLSGRLSLQIPDANTAEIDEILDTLSDLVSAFERLLPADYQADVENLKKAGVLLQQLRNALDHRG